MRVLQASWKTWEQVLLSQAGPCRSSSSWRRCSRPFPWMRSWPPTQSQPLWPTLHRLNPYSTQFPIKRWIFLIAYYYQYYCSYFLCLPSLFCYYFLLLDIIVLCKTSESSITWGFTFHNFSKFFLLAGCINYWHAWVLHWAGHAEGRIEALPWGPQVW